MQNITQLSMYSIISLQPIVQLVYLDYNSLLDNKSPAMAVLTSKCTLCTLRAHVKPMTDVL